MSKSLQDQLLKAGLVDKKAAKKINQDKRKQTKLEQKGQKKAVNETKALAQQALKEKADRAREHNRQRELIAEQKAITAQIKQLIETNKVNRDASKTDIGYSFAHHKKIKKLYVDSKMQRQLERGILAIVVVNNQYELVPAPVAEKISQRDESYVVLLNSQQKQIDPDSDDRYYAQFEIPDDLDW